MPWSARAWPSPRMSSLFPWRLLPPCVPRGERPSRCEGRCRGFLLCGQRVPDTSEGGGAALYSGGISEGLGGAAGVPGLSLAARRSNVKPDKAGANQHAFQMFTFARTTTCRACRMLLRLVGVWAPAWASWPRGPHPPLPTQGHLLPGLPVCQVWCRGPQGVSGGDPTMQDR